MIINIFGGPGIGKSTFSAELYSILKKSQYNVGLLNEFATYLVIENNIKALENNQYYVTGKQLYDQEIYENKYDIVITDSPILLGIIYNKPSKANDIYNEFLLNKFEEKFNLNILLERNDDDYTTVGRRHNVSEALWADKTIKDLLNKQNYDYIEINREQIYDYLPYIKQKFNEYILFRQKS